MKVRKRVDSTLIGIPIQRAQDRKPPAEQIFKTASQRIQLSSLAFSTSNLETRVQIRYKSTQYYGVPVLHAITACYIDQIVSTLDYASLEDILKISYRRAEERNQYYIGIFTLDLSRLNINFTLVHDPAIKARISKAISRLSIRIETNPFFVPDANVDLVDDIGIINSISESPNAADFLARLREPEEKILVYLADQLENKLKKSTFLKNAFVRKSEEIIERLLSQGRSL